MTVGQVTCDSPKEVSCLSVAMTDTPSARSPALAFVPLPSDRRLESAARRGWTFVLALPPSTARQPPGTQHRTHRRCWCNLGVCFRFGLAMSEKRLPTSCSEQMACPGAGKAKSWARHAASPRRSPPCPRAIPVSSGRGAPAAGVGSATDFLAAANPVVSSCPPANTSDRSANRFGVRAERRPVEHRPSRTPARHHVWISTSSSLGRR